jgi:hypothetical protein
VARLCCEFVYEELQIVVKFLATFRSIKENMGLLAAVRNEAPSKSVTAVRINANAGIEAGKKKLTEVSHRTLLRAPDSESEFQGQRCKSRDADSFSPEFFGGNMG